MLQLTADGDANVNSQELAAVLDPLVENAVHHTPVGGVVNVTLAAGSTELHVEVLNTGNGVPDRLRHNLFDPWVSSRPAADVGGLGLWLARETARASGGDVWLERWRSRQHGLLRPVAGPIATRPRARRQHPVGLGPAAAEPSGQGYRAQQQRHRDHDRE